MIHCHNFSYVYRRHSVRLHAKYNGLERTAAILTRSSLLRSLRYTMQQSNFCAISAHKTCMISKKRKCKSEKVMLIQNGWVKPWKTIYWTRWRTWGKYIKMLSPKITVVSNYDFSFLLNTICSRVHGICSLMLKI